MNTIIVAITDTITDVTTEYDLDNLETELAPDFALDETAGLSEDGTEVVTVGEMIDQMADAIRRGDEDADAYASGLGLRIEWRCRR